MCEGVFAAGFVNPYASGYSADTLAYWVILSAWILYERQTRSISRNSEAVSPLTTST